MYSRFFPDDHRMERTSELVQEIFNNAEGSGSINVKFIWGVSGIDESSAKTWDAEEFGHIVWDDAFTLAPPANQLRFIDICE